MLKINFEDCKENIACHYHVKIGQGWGLKSQYFNVRLICAGTFFPVISHSILCSTSKAKQYKGYQ